MLDASFAVGVENVTIYAFSIENFSRPKEEVDCLFNLLKDRLEALSGSRERFVKKRRIRIRIIGNRSLIPENILPDIESIEESTNFPDATQVLNVCFPYTSRDEMAHSIRCIAEQRATNSISRDEITEQLVNDNLYFGKNGVPLDLLIRTSGHQRLSDFMLWQCNNRCQMWFADVLWPDFGFFELLKALMSYAYDVKVREIRESLEAEEKPLRRKNIALGSLPRPPAIVEVGKR